MDSSICFSLLSFSHESILEHIFYNDYNSEMVDRNCIELVAVKEKQQLVHIVLEKPNVTNESLIKV